MEKQVINLNDLINRNINELPEFVNEKNIVYCCKNLVNGKVYIGETKRTLRERWLEHKRYFVEDSNRDIQMMVYTAIRKYGIDNFDVSVLESGLNEDNERKEREKYWVKKYNSYVDSENSGGYNMTIGGYAETKFTKTRNEKIKKTCIEKYGCLPFNTKESRKKAIETNRKNHNGKLAFQLPESRKKALETQYKKYGKLAVHLPENQEKAKIAMREKYGDVLPFNTKEAIEKAQKSAPLHRMIGCICRHIKILENKNLEINARNYVLETNDIKHMWQQHVPNVLRRLEELRKIYKWSEDMENIFSNITYDETRKGINKIIFTNEN